LEIVKNVPSGGSAPLPDHPVDDQFAIGVNGNKCPRIASITACQNLRGDVLLLGRNKRPDFVNLNRLGFEVYQRAI
jgi:hypothetical protein